MQQCNNSFHFFLQAFKVVYIFMEIVKTELRSKSFFVFDNTPLACRYKLDCCPLCPTFPTFAPTTVGPSTVRSMSVSRSFFFFCIIICNTETRNTSLVITYRYSIYTLRVMTRRSNILLSVRGF